MPKDNHPPAMRFYFDDFISDSAVDAMTNEELGIYMRLFCKAWKESPVGTIPNDDRVLANWGKATPAAWKKCKPGVLRAFALGDDGRYHQKRMEKEWEKALAYQKSRADAGGKGAQKRWHSDGTGNGSAIAGGMAQGMAKNSLSSSSSLSSSFSGVGDDDGAIDITLGEDARVRARAARIFRKSGVGAAVGDMSLVAKVAVLWDSGEFSDNDIEQVLESFSAGKSKINNRGAWLHKCLSNRCDASRRDFDKMLATTSVPIGLMLQTAEAGR